MGNSESRAEFTKELAKVDHFEQVDDYHPDYPCIHSWEDIRWIIMETPNMKKNDMIPFVPLLEDAIKNGDLTTFSQIVDKYLCNKYIFRFARRLIELFDNADLKRAEVIAIKNWVLAHRHIEFHRSLYKTFTEFTDAICHVAPESKLMPIVEFYNNKCCIDCIDENCDFHTAMQMFLVSAIERKQTKLVETITKKCCRVEYSTWLLATSKECFEPAIIVQLLFAFPSGIQDVAFSAEQIEQCREFVRGVKGTVVEKIHRLILVGCFDDAKKLANTVPKKSIEWCKWNNVSMFLSDNWNMYSDKRHYSLHCWFITNTTMYVCKNVSEIPHDMFRIMTNDNLENALYYWDLTYSHNCGYIKTYNHLGDYFGLYEYNFKSYPKNEQVPDIYIRKCIARNCNWRHLKKMILFLGIPRFRTNEIRKAIAESSPCVLAVFVKFAQLHTKRFSTQLMKEINYHLCLTIC